jgi:hypothetical protein
VLGRPKTRRHPAGGGKNRRVSDFDLIALERETAFNSGAENDLKILARPRMKAIYSLAKWAREGVSLVSALEAASKLPGWPAMVLSVLTRATSTTLEYCAPLPPRFPVSVIPTGVRSS